MASLRRIAAACTGTWKPRPSGTHRHLALLSARSNGPFELMFLIFPNGPLLRVHPPASPTSYPLLGFGRWNRSSIGCLSVASS
jgi:hypothetical protein